VNQWIIYDYYEKYEKMKEVEDKNELEEEYKPNPSKKKDAQELQTKEEEDVDRRILRSAKVLERMVNLNTFDDVAQDFRFWEDQSDEYKDVEGSLLPLWKFSFERAKKLEITGLCWNPKYCDLFAATYGSYNFYTQQDMGFVCLFSLKNPSYPEFLCEAHCGVMCVDIHPQHPHMVVVGLYDGNIAVYNLQIRSSVPTYMSTAQNGKHKDVVWQVKWVRDNLDGYLNFYSVSGDGRVTNWTIVKTALWFTDQLVINFEKTLLNFGDEKIGDHLLDSGRSIAFKPDEENIFLVGTEEGLVYMATTQYSSQYLMTYPAHSTPVYNIQWNTFIPQIFITCASEFVVKLWHKDSTKPILRFDLGSQVGDIVWAPYSSTVFAAVTIEGKVYVYDLHINKYSPICMQVI
jgi:dynein intermediate chain 1